jgi:hypothetical protein
MITYFVQMGDSVKIGTTNNPKHRLMQLKVSFPYDLTLLGLADLPEKEAQRLAATFTKRRNGEWFEYNSELITWIKSLPATTSKWAGFEFRPIPKMKGESVRVNISIDQVILRAGQKLALDQGISFSALISQLVRENQAKG